MNLKSLILATTLVVSSFSLYAENSSEQLRKTLTSVQYRISAQADNPDSNQLSGLDAWINKSEINWGNSDLDDFEDQKLSYEIQLKNREQINTEQAILDLGRVKAQLKRSSYLDKKLQYRYASFIDLLEQEKQQQLLQQKHALVNSDLNHWKLKINSDTFRADKLQQADLSLDQVWGEMLENGGTLERLRNDPANIVVGNTLSIHQMLKIEQQILKSGEYQQHNLRIQKAEMDIQLANNEQQRHEAQQKLSLGSFKLEYDNKDDDFGVSVGIKMPVTKNSFDSLQEKQAVYYANLDAKNTRFEIEDQLREKQNLLYQLQHQWLSSQQVLQKMNTRIKRLSTSTNIDLLLDLKAQRLDVLKRQNRVSVQALRQYISFLNTAGMLSAKPYRNWLLKGTPQLF